MSWNLTIGTIIISTRHGFEVTSEWTMNNKKGLDVDAILREMSDTKEQVALEILRDDEAPLILQEDDSYSLEELIEELEEEHDIVFNI